MTYMRNTMKLSKIFILNKYSNKDFEIHDGGENSFYSLLIAIGYNLQIMIIYYKF